MDLTNYRIEQTVDIFKNDPEFKNQLFDNEIFLEDATYKQLAELLLSNNSTISDNTIDELNEITPSFLRSEISTLFGKTFITQAIYFQVFYTYKYSAVSTFFRENYHKFLPDFDVLQIKSSDKMRIFQEAFMREFDRLAFIIDEIYNVPDIDKIPSEYLSYLAQAIGYEREDRVLLSDASFRELIKNIIEIYKIKGTNYSFELFFNFLGFESEVKEFWFDKRYGDPSVTSNTFTGSNNKDLYIFYLTTTKPTEHIPEGMRNPYLITENEISDTKDLNNFNRLIESGLYTAQQLIGYESGYEGEIYTFFKTNIIQYSLSSLIQSGSEEDELSSEDITIIQRYVEFLTPIFIQKSILITAQPVQSNVDGLIITDENRTDPMFPMTNENSETMLHMYQGLQPSHYYWSDGVRFYDDPNINTSYPFRWSGNSIEPGGHFVSGYYNDTRALVYDPDEATSVYNNVGEVSSDPLFYFSFNAEDATDDSGNGHDGTIHGGVSFVDGIAGKAASFDGIDGWMLSPDPFTGGNFSVSFWIYLNEDKNAGILYLRNAVLRHKVLIRYGSFFKALEVGWRYEDGSNMTTDPDTGYSISSVVFTASGSIQINNWYHVVCQVNGEVARIYVDGSLNAERENIGGIEQNYNAFSFSAQIGNLSNYSGNNHLNGYLDEIRFYDTFLSKYDILALYDNPPLIAYGHTEKMGAISSLISSGGLFENPFDIPDRDLIYPLIDKDGDDEPYDIGINPMDDFGVGTFLKLGKENEDHYATLTPSSTFYLSEEEIPFANDIYNDADILSISEVSSKATIEISRNIVGNSEGARFSFLNSPGESAFLDKVQGDFSTGSEWVENIDLTDEYAPALVEDGLGNYAQEYFVGDTVKYSGQTLIFISYVEVGDSISIDDWVQYKAINLVKLGQKIFSPDQLFGNKVLEIDIADNKFRVSRISYETYVDQPIEIYTEAKDFIEIIRANDASNNGVYEIYSTSVDSVADRITITLTSPLRGLAQASSGGKIIIYKEPWLLKNSRYSFLYNRIEVETEIT